MYLRFAERGITHLFLRHPSRTSIKICSNSGTNPTADIAGTCTFEIKTNNCTTSRAKTKKNHEHPRKLRKYRGSTSNAIQYPNCQYILDQQHNENTLNYLHKLSPETLPVVN